MQEFKKQQLPLHDPEGDTKCWNCQHYRSDTEGGPCDSCTHPIWDNFKNVRHALAKVTAERDTLAQAVHMLSADTAALVRQMREALKIQDAALQRGSVIADVAASVSGKRAIAAADKWLAEDTTDSRRIREALAGTWQRGYEEGVADERTSKASIGIAGFGAKVIPARVNPFATSTSLDDLL